MEKLLKSKNTALWITTLAILVLIFKTAPVFRQLSFPNPSDQISTFQFWFEWLSSFLSVTIIEVAVLLFIAKGNKAESYAFAIVSFLSSLYYFNSFYFTDFRLNVMYVIWSLIYPFVIVRFSHFYKSESEGEDALMVQISELKASIKELNTQKDSIMKDKSDLKAEKEQLKASIEENKAYLIELKAHLEQQHKRIEQLQTQNENTKAEYEKTQAELSVWVDRHTCSGCGKVFDNVQQLSGHKKGCN